MRYELFEDVRAPLFALLGQPIVIIALVLLAGIHAAIWLLVLERTGLPPLLATLLLVPPLTLLVPLCVALARWPSLDPRRIPRRVNVVRFPSGYRRAQRRPPRPSGPERVPGEFHGHHPLRLRADGLPVFRIPLVPAHLPESWPAARGMAPQDLYASLGQLGP